MATARWLAACFRIVYRYLLTHPLTSQVHVLGFPHLDSVTSNCLKPILDYLQQQCNAFMQRNILEELIDASGIFCVLLLFLFSFYFVFSI
jgi:hypothetical protein